METGINQSLNKEAKMKPQFYEQEIIGTEPAWCVDGRDGNTPKGPQMLGGSLLPVLLYAITNDLPFSQDTIAQSLSQLETSGYQSGIHRGPHAHEDKSDCGFADNLPLILQTAVAQQTEILTRLGQVVDANPDIFTNGQALKESFQDKYQMLISYNQTQNDKLMTAESLIKFCADRGANQTMLIGDHAEVAAYVNLKPQTTLNVQESNQNGQPAFNLDLWAVTDQTQALDVDAETAQALSLILYVATEMVLVEQKGKPSLPIILHA